MLHRFLTIVPVPPSFRDPGDPLPLTAHHVRPAVLGSPVLGPTGPGPTGPGPTGLGPTGLGPTVLGRPPTVYFTLGTIFNQESGDLFPRVLRALSGLPVEVVVTIGNELDPSEIGPQPANVRVERFLPPASVMARADAVVSHAGSGTVIAALAFGLPQVLLPMGADQPLNADRCQSLGVAVVLDAVASTADEIAAAAVNALEDRRYRDRAGAVQEEIRSLPGPEHAASLLEQLAASKAPVEKG
jgi:MGT family glycosyltransferase